MALTPLLTSKKEYFYAIQAQLLYGILTGMNCLGYQDIYVDDTTAVGLTPPTGASKAVIVAEADATATATDKIIRYKEDETAPTDISGMPLGDLSIYECGGDANLANILFIGIEAGKTHKLRVSYYG